MTTAVLIPWAATDEWRTRALAHVTAWWRSLGYDPVLGRHDGPWRKALAVADALARTDADVLVVADADVFVPGVERAIALVEQGAPYAIPHVRVHRLTERATTQLYETGTHDGEMEKGCPYVGVVGGGMVVLRRDVYEDCPLDASYAGWGREDEAFGLALEVLHGPPERLDNPLWHLWHPAPPRLNRRDPLRPESQERYLCYLRAHRRWSKGLPDGAEAMRALVDEARHLTCAGPAT